MDRVAEARIARPQSLAGLDDDRFVEADGLADGILRIDRESIEPLPAGRVVPDRRHDRQGLATRVEERDHAPPSSERMDPFTQDGRRGVRRAQLRRQ